MQIYLQILSTICYPVSRDQFVDLCPALSKFAHGLDFLKGKFILSGLCAVRGAGCEPGENLFNNRQTHQLLYKG